MMITKIELVRRLLGTATQLFLDDADPISVHCLASSALEHAEHLAATNSGSPLTQHILATNATMTATELRRLRNKHYRVIKHSHDLKGNAFIISKELEGFDDTSNDAVLFAGWHDFMQADAPIPIAAQVLQLWFFRLYPKSLDPNKDFQFPLFDNIASERRGSQKRLLRLAIEEVSKMYEVVSHPRTDLRNLIL